eukprot:NODE_955_length_1096_cov_50.922601_g911_i0.p1 GENE.NODE_955_length_1096_cov_50.922601_g911_i0~~NODE_955_length_1096_cov_50.922601_g911_i0.p1  ORF type:complete len:310 (-),score=50.54 NODE_955_length_1096_cov_50.922601_g911_i0:82-1011(-)
MTDVPTKVSGGASPGSLSGGASPGSLIREDSKSHGWEQHPDGKWHKLDYYKIENQEPVLPPRVLPEGIEILDRLWVGCWQVTENTKWMADHNISRVIVLGDSASVNLPSGINLKVIAINLENALTYLDEACSLIKEGLSEGSSILMVCSDGLTWCPLIIVAYLMTVMGWSLETSIKRIEEIFKISCVQWMHILREWDAKLTVRKTVTKTEVVAQPPPVVVAEPAPVVVAAPPPAPVIAPSYGWSYGAGFGYGYGGVGYGVGTGYGCIGAGYGGIPASYGSVAPYGLGGAGYAAPGFGYGNFGAGFGRPW